MHYIKRPDWALPESAATPEDVYLNRRALLAGMGLGAGLAMMPGRSEAAGVTPFQPMPATHSGYADAGRAITPEALNTTYNNFYEFGSSKRISDEAQRLNTDGWTVRIDGLVEDEITISTEDLIARMPLEERVYRHRCVEAWSMVAPWVGFELSALLDLARPLSSARYVQFQTFHDTDMAPEQRASWWPWPYTEALSMAEASNELSFMVVGAYGKLLHKPMGAPIRLHTPWKYGFKSIKSIDRITFTEERPVSFWEELNASEYGFWANVNPEVAHPRWSQADERVLGQDGRVPTELYNGYGAQVAGMYGDLPLQVGERFWR
ncbi:protein-methionine-sulfoxide reductase catalytic subunit MsrP [Pontivivens insulae]|uniref:Protein-methionine-sulfoxide reductase catalytic subunit MsrP n=1 Tax=Pontivivens insulae TaxID=1639689 RepID=A0A2R8ABD7_9RHOB|nr:protein-methionine-sulfoxide reductase catalytic subunit MsrP [Pontivivens insulae]RED11300.1 sulfoxide reductase catalytic subunit YedY [Pontivivens insulae]SPF29527.1 Protein-methionine-sulfoxide reductase catalytic subunit MsrP [Pontivivens insulae]